MSDLIIDTNVMAGALFGRSLALLKDLDSRGFALVTPRHQADELEGVARAIARRRGAETPPVDIVMQVVEVVEPAEYDFAEAPARARLTPAGQPDWPLLALSLTTGASIMTRDTDLFGTGVVTWLPSNIHHADAETSA